MIKSALQYIVGLKKAEVYEINGKNYVDKDVDIVNPVTKCCDLTVSTLSALCNYIKASCDKNDLESKLLIVNSHEHISLSGETSCEQNFMRNNYIEARASIPHLCQHNYMDMESFIVQLQTCFDRKQGDWESLIKLASTIQIKDEVKTSDDGMSQQITAKTGVACLGEVKLPNPVFLAPIRTFHEIEQPLSPFVFRISKDGQMGLFEADGGAWKNEAIMRIKEYLEKELADSTSVTIMA